MLASLKAFRNSRLTRSKYSDTDPRYELFLSLGRVLYELNVLTRLLMIGTNRFEQPDTVAKLHGEVADLLTEHSTLLTGAAKTVEAGVSRSQVH